MGRKASSTRIVKHKVGLYEGDFEKLQALFPQRGGSSALREMLRNFLVRVESTPSQIDIDIQTEVDIPND